MKRTRGILLSVACLLLTLLFFASCGPTTTPMVGTTTPAGGTTLNPNGTDGTSVTLTTSYQIVHRRDEKMAAIAQNLQTAIKTATGLELPVLESTMATPSVLETEIVVGDLSGRVGGNRVGCEKGISDYALDAHQSTISGTRIVLMGGSETAIRYAVEQFVANYVTGKTAVSIPANLDVSGKVPATTYEVGTIASENILLYGGATASANGITLGEDGAGVAFNLSALTSLDATFKISGGSATLTIYRDKGKEVKTVTVANGDSVKRTLFTLVGSETAQEYYIVKNSGGTCVLTGLSAVGTFGNKPTAAVAMRTFDAKTYAAKFKRQGRSWAVSDGLTCDWSANSFEFNIMSLSGTDITANLNSASQDVYFAVYVDGVVVNDHLKAPKGVTSVTLASGLSAGEHEVRLVRLTHVRQSNCTLQSISMSAVFGKTPANNAKYIEFIGDSYTAGWGARLTAADISAGASGGSAPYCDATKSYAYLTAQYFGADYSLVACSGHGVCGRDDDRTFADGTYEINVSNEYLAFNMYRDTAKQTFVPTGEYSYFDSNPRKPDLIVIYLGDNDKNKTTADKIGGYVKNMVKVVQDKNGKNIPIIWIYDNTETKFHDAIKTAINELKTAGNNIYFLSVAQDKSVQNHPSPAGAKAVSDALNTLIANNITGFTAK